MILDLPLGIALGLVIGLALGLVFWVLAVFGPGWRQWGRDYLYRRRVARSDAVRTAAMNRDAHAAYLSTERDLIAIRAQRDNATQQWGEWEAKGKRLMAERAAREAEEKTKTKTRKPKKAREKRTR